MSLETSSCSFSRPYACFCSSSPFPCVLHPLDIVIFHSLDPRPGLFSLIFCKGLFSPQLSLWPIARISHCNSWHLHAYGPLDLGYGWALSTWSSHSRSFQVKSAGLCPFSHLRSPSEPIKITRISHHHKMEPTGCVYSFRAALAQINIGKRVQPILNEGTLKLITLEAQPPAAQHVQRVMEVHIDGRLLVSIVQTSYFVFWS